MTEIKEFIKDGALKAVEKDKFRAIRLIKAAVSLDAHYLKLEKAVIEKVGKARYAEALERVVTDDKSSLDFLLETIRYTTTWQTREVTPLLVIMLTTATPNQRLAAMLLALASLEEE